MRLPRPVATLALLFLMLSRPAAGQQPPDSARGPALRVYLDCQTFYCDLDFLRREITFVNWMRDQADADVHILGTSQQTGGGGEEYTLTFLGHGPFEALRDTLRFVTGNTATDAEVREQLAHTVRLGLIRYVARLPEGRRIEITYKAPNGADTTALHPRDPWNSWVFQISLSGFAQGQALSKEWSANARVVANRVTDNWKMHFSSGGSRSLNSYVLSDSTYDDRTHSFDSYGLIVRSLGSHWSAGVEADVNSSTYYNRKLSVRGGPAVEFDVYPYSQSTRQQVTVRYGIQPVYVAYEDTTIFDLLHETRPTHHLDVGAAVTQAWGTLRGSVSASQYLHDLTRHSIDMFGEADIRIVRGLSFNVFGRFERLKDQIYLPKAGASDAEILLQRRQLGTDYEYFVNFGLTYRFGSKYNNVVNPRFNN